MEDFNYRIDVPSTSILCSDDDQLGISGVGNNYMIHDQFDQQQMMMMMTKDSSFGISDQMFDLMKTQITSHPRYRSLISAYVECRKLGAAPQIASVLDDICREIFQINGGLSDIGTDPELDEFMEAYCLFLRKYKDELSKPLDEATTFFSNIERQFSKLFNETSTTGNSVNRQSDEASGSSEEEQSCVDVEPSSSQTTNPITYGDRALKEMLLHKYSGCVDSLMTQFLTKRKKGKLPKDSRTALLDWWNTHYRWPYPTEEEKMKLVEITGLNQKQITNWFINQRKRHWKPSNNQCLALMNSLSDAVTPTMYFHTVDD